MIDPKSDRSFLCLLKRAMLSHLNAVSQLLRTKESIEATSIDLHREYTLTTRLLDDIEVLIARKEV
jgi:hypothetical protein